MTLNTLKQWKPYPNYKPSGVDWLGDEKSEEVRRSGFNSVKPLQKLKIIVGA